MPARHPALRSLRWTIGLLIVTAGLAALVERFWQQWLAGNPTLQQALLGGGLAALATALGTLPAALSRDGVSDRVRDALLGFGAGVMLAACSFSLIVPALAAARDLGMGRGEAAVGVGAALLAGAALLLALERWVPHEHFIKGREYDAAHGARLKRVWLFVFAITLHNLPEGLAIGAGFAGGDVAAGSALAAGIAIQDVPEGMVVAMALRAVGYGTPAAVLLGSATGLVEPLGAAAGVLIVGASAAMLPWGLAFAAGAMLFVISHEIIPESHRAGHEALATAGLMLGFVLMMVLDNALG